MKIKQDPELNYKVEYGIDKIEIIKQEPPKTYRNFFPNTTKFFDELKRQRLFNLRKKRQ